MIILSAVEWRVRGVLRPRELLLHQLGHCGAPFIFIFTSAHGTSLIAVRMDDTERLCCSLAEAVNCHIARDRSSGALANNTRKHQYLHRPSAQLAAILTTCAHGYRLQASFFSFPLSEKMKHVFIKKTCWRIRRQKVRGKHVVFARETLHNRRASNAWSIVVSYREDFPWFTSAFARGPTRALIIKLVLKRAVRSALCKVKPHRRNKYKNTFGLSVILY